VALQLRRAAAIVGRDDATADITALMRRSRLVTVAGPGGIGKTCLAEHVAAIAVEQPAKDVAFVDLAPLNDGELIPDAITRAAGLELGSQSDSLEALVAGLRAQRLLVVLDNCEHLVGECARVATALIRECAGVRLLATSREPLNLDFERVYRLGPLAEDAAIELLELHARRDHPDYAFSDADLPTVREICKRLDGIALAIELAAPYVHLMPLGQLKARLDGHFRLLIGAGRRSVTTRHQTVETLIDWSYARLSEDERAVFRRAAVFSDGFSEDAGRAIAGDALGALIEKSMLVHCGDRLRMLEPVRQYALERSEAEGDEPQARRSFANYYAAIADDAARRFGYGTQEAWLERLEPELEHFRAALDWAHDHDVPLATRLLTNLIDFWELANLAAEGLRRSEAILAVTRDPEGREALPILLAIARLSMIAHVYWHSFELYERAKTLALRYGDARAHAEALRIGARARRILGIDTRSCVPELRDALEEIRKEGNPYRIARTLTDYGFELIDSGDDDGGRAILKEAEAATSALGWPHLSAHLEINLAELEFRTESAAAAAERGRRLAAALQMRTSSTMYALALTNLAAYLSVLGEYDEAFERSYEAVQAALARDLHFCVAWALQSVAIVLVKRGKGETAARLLGYVDEYVEFTASKREPTERIVQKRLLDIIRQTLGEQTLEQQKAFGRKLSEREAVHLAFG
jgi:predicted ATPase